MALAIVIAGAAALVYGIISWRNGGDFGVYFALFGFAAVFFFSGAHVLPTAKNNKRAVARAWEEAQANLENVLPEDFPLPPRYAHPVVLTRMIRVLREGRAQSVQEALEVVKSDLKALNADVQVEQEEYDEAEDALFSLVRAAFQAGWLAAGGEESAAVRMFEVLRAEDFRKKS